MDLFRAQKIRKPVFHWESPLLYLLPKQFIAITLGHHIFFRFSPVLTPQNEIRHELIHVGQYQRDGVAKFLIRYLWQALTKGYHNIDYEIEARGKTS